MRERKGGRERKTETETKSHPRLENFLNAKIESQRTGPADCPGGSLCRILSFIITNNYLTNHEKSESILHIKHIRETPRSERFTRR